jgi:hypothetical protein
MSTTTPPPLSTTEPILKVVDMVVDTLPVVDTKTSLSTTKTKSNKSVVYNQEVKVDCLQPDIVKPLEVELINGKCQGYGVNPHTKEHYCNSCEYHQYRNKTKP